jgi:hypothetical protein
MFAKLCYHIDLKGRSTATRRRWKASWCQASPCGSSRLADVPTTMPNPPATSTHQRSRVPLWPHRPLIHRRRGISAIAPPPAANVH